MILGTTMKNLTSVRLFATGLPLGISEVGSCLEQQTSGASKLARVLVTSPCSVDARTLVSQERCCGIGMWESSYHQEHSYSLRQQRLLSFEKNQQGWFYRIFPPAPLSWQPISSVGCDPVSLGRKIIFLTLLKTSELVMSHSFEITGGLFSSYK